MSKSISHDGVRAFPRHRPVNYRRQLEYPSGSETLSRKAYIAVRRAIREGDLVPGQFYSELQLARVFDVSRTPVREAVIELAREGAVEKIPQRGFMLRVPTLSDISEAYDLRQLIEAYVVRRFAAEAPSDAIADLEATMERQAAALGTPEALPEIDEEFHLGMAAALSLDRSYRALLTLRPPIWLPGAAADRDSTRVRQALTEHREVVDRIAARDADGAVLAISRHITRSAEAAKERWSKFEATAGQNSFGATVSRA